MNLPASQRGMSIWSMLLIASMVVTSFLAGMRIVPIYLSNMAVQSSLQGLAADPEAATMSKSQLRNRLMRRLEVDDMDDVIDAKQIKLQRVEGGTLISVDYENRIPLVANIDLVGKFAESAVVPKH